MGGNEALFGIFEKVISRKLGVYDLYKHTSVILTSVQHDQALNHLIIIHQPLSTRIPVPLHPNHFPQP